MCQHLHKYKIYSVFISVCTCCLRSCNDLEISMTWRHCLLHRRTRPIPMWILCNIWGHNLWITREAWQASRDWQLTEVHNNVRYWSCHMRLPLLYVYTAKLFPRLYIQRTDYCIVPCCGHPGLSFILVQAALSRDLTPITSGAVHSILFLIWGMAIV